MHANSTRAAMGRDKTAAGTEVGPHASLSSLLSCSLRPFLARTSSHLLVHPSVQPCSAACCAYAARSLSLTHTYHTTHPLNGCRQQLFCAASPKPTNHSVGWALHSSPTCISHATVASHTTHIHTHTHTHPMHPRRRLQCRPWQLAPWGSGQSSETNRQRNLVKLAWQGRAIG